MIDKKTIKMTIKRNPNQMSLFDQEDQPQIYSTQKFQDVKQMLGLFLVLKDDKFGLLDDYGEEILPCEFDDIEVLSCDYFLATKNHVTKIYQKNGTLLKLDAEYHVHKYSCTHGLFLLRRLEGFEKSPRYAIYNLQINDYIAYWTSYYREFGPRAFMREEKYGNWIVFSPSDGAEMVKRIIHFEQSAMVERNGNSFCLYDESGCVWKDKGF